MTDWILRGGDVIDGTGRQRWRADVAIAGDRIAAVSQSKDNFVDVVDMKLEKVVELIRGKKGSTVRLQIIPSDTSDPSKRKVVELVRDNVKLTEQEEIGRAHV